MNLDKKENLSGFYTNNSEHGNCTERTLSMNKLSLYYYNYNNIGTSNIYRYNIILLFCHKKSSLLLNRFFSFHSFFFICHHHSRTTVNNPQHNITYIKHIKSSIKDPCKLQFAHYLCCFAEFSLVVTIVAHANVSEIIGYLLICVVEHNSWLLQGNSQARKTCPWNLDVGTRLRQPIS